MTQTRPSSAQAAPGIPLWGWAIIAFAIVNLVILHASAVPLSPRELQYWLLAQSFAFGYEGNGPLLPWLISIATFIGGNNEFAVRMWGPLFAALGTGFSVAIARRFLAPRAGVMAGFALALIPFISIGALEASVWPMLFAFVAMTAWSLTRYEAKPRFRYMVLAGGACGLAIVTMPQMALMAGMIAGLWLSIKPLRDVMRRDAWIVFSFTVTFITAPSLLFGQLSLSPTDHHHAGIIDALGIWAVAPAGLGAVLIVLVAKLASRQMVVALAALSLLQLAAWALGAALFFNPTLDAALTASVKPSSSASLLYQHYRPRALARLISREWEDGEYEGIATNKASLIAPLKFYGPRRTPLYWLADDASPNSSRAVARNTQALPFISDKPVLGLVDDEASLNHKRLINPVIISRTQDAAGKTWIVFAAYLKA